MKAVDPASWKMGCDWAEGDLQNSRRVGEVNWPTAWSHPHSVELVMKGQNMGVKVIDYVTFKSGRL